MNNYLYDELLVSCTKEGISLTAWAKQNNLAISTPTSIKQGIRPAPETLKALTYAWSIPEYGIRIFCAYIKDEIERVGLSLDNLELVLKSEKVNPALDDDLRTLENFMSDNATMREAIHSLAALCRVSKKQSKESIIAGAKAFDGLYHKPTPTSKSTKTKSRNG